MSRQVDREQIALYLLGELDDRATADVEALVATDPLWAAALQEEAQLDMALFEVADAAATSAVREASPVRPDASTGRSWLGAWRQMLGGLIMAALALWWIPRGSATLPAYELDLRGGGEVMVRGAADASDAPARYVAGSQMDLVLRPAESVGAPLDVAVNLDGAPWPVTPAVLDSGTVRLQGVFGDTLPLPGEGTHVLEVRLRLKGDSDAAWVSHQVTFVVGTSAAPR